MALVVNWKRNPKSNELRKIKDGDEVVLKPDTGLGHDVIAKVTAVHDDNFDATVVHILAVPPGPPGAVGEMAGFDGCVKGQILRSLKMENVFAVGPGETGSYGRGYEEPRA